LSSRTETTPATISITGGTATFGRDKAILREREKIKKKTLRQRRLQHEKQAA